MKDQPCLVCGARSTDEAHWPVAKGMGGRPLGDDLPTVYLCHECHMKQHSYDDATIGAIIRKAPIYWRQTGRWEANRPVFEKYLDRLEYRLATGARLS